MPEPTGVPERGRRPPGRSPNYPGLSLAKAIQRVGLVLDKEGRYPANIATIAAHMGYSSPTSGPFTTTYAAVKKFGLLEEEGSGTQRQARVSDLGYRVLRAPEPQRADAVREAALLPPIHREMRSRYPHGLPSEENLLWQLEQDLGFTRSGAADFLRKYRATIAFAGLDEVDAIEESADAGSVVPSDSWDEARDGALTSPGLAETRSELPSQIREGISIPIPLVGGSSVTIQGKFPIGEAAWQQLLSVLQAMKPGLVTASDPPATTAADGSEDV